MVFFFAFVFFGIFFAAGIFFAGLCFGGLTGGDGATGAGKGLGLLPPRVGRELDDSPWNRGAPTCTEFGNGGAVGRFMCYLDHLQATAPTD